MAYDPELPWGCRNCGRHYKHQSTMHRHRKQCEGVYDLACPVCGKCFHRRDRYQHHLQKEHQTVDAFKGTFKKVARKPDQQGNDDTL